LEKSILFRFFFILVLAGVGIGLFLGNESQPTKPQVQSQQNLTSVMKELDQQVDTVFAKFRIEKKWCRRREIAIPGSNLNRVERNVMIPPDIIPVQINRALNLMAQRYGGRAIGSENLKENTVTIHIKLEDYIIETIILKISKDLKRGGKKNEL
jgi:hypothetical protein